ncbi:hypothetical protein NC99_35990 [Sunxiuqinia dokdonensis]|uniref:Uncharacterized protein n=1 Tax=Sunxiuqinia dokdonensis TaxID=1409788 RepID=A0A0L8V4U7_9BACT|nr:hypothetical protein NC99_35990 [Sunxiuqinia dokdonensis]
MSQAKNKSAFYKLSFFQKSPFIVPSATLLLGREHDLSQDFLQHITN